MWDFTSNITGGDRLIMKANSDSFFVLTFEYTFKYACMALLAFCLAFILSALLGQVIPFWAVMSAVGAHLLRFSALVVFILFTSALFESIR